MKAVIITDLDGTLIDHHTYSADSAAPAVRNAQEKNIPICICSSKTRSEILHYRSMLDISDPFISENGGAVFIPAGYFSPKTAPAEGFEIIVLGTPYKEIVAALRDVREGLRAPLRGFHDMTAAELARESGLPLHLAALALDREYDEPFRIEGTARDVERVACALQKRCLQVTRGGRFHHVMGGNDKGKAAVLLESRFRQHFPNVVFVGVGDSANDIPMLNGVDIPILVKGHAGIYDEETLRAVPGVRLADGIGPQGWNAAVNDLISEWK